MDLTTIFYHSDDFSKLFEKKFNFQLLTDGDHKRKKEFSLTLGEIIAIIIYYHNSGYKNFKNYYKKSAELQSAFPTMPSYNRFIELQKKTIIPLFLFLRLLCDQEECDGVSFIDSFPLKVSHPNRATSHKTFRGLAKWGKTSVGWFFGFKLHVIINGYGKILDFIISSGNVLDNNQNIIEKITQSIYGKVYGDKGYLLNQNLFQKLYNDGIELITKIRKNMENKLMNIRDKLMLKKRGIIESVGAVLKEDLNIEHSRYRSPITLFINVFSALIAYSFRPKKPTIYKNTDKQLETSIA